MPAANRAAKARWRRKKLDDNPREFRAKEATRLRNYRAQTKQKQKHFLHTHLEDSGVVQDGVDACLYDAVSYSQTSHSDSERSLHFSSTHPTRSIENLNDHDVTLLTPDLLASSTFQDAHGLLANGRKTLREWDRRWGTGTIFSHRAAGAFVSIGLVKDRSDRARDETVDMIQKLKEALSQLESVAFIDLRSTELDEYRSFWIECIRVIEGLLIGLCQIDGVPRSMSPSI